MASPSAYTICVQVEMLPRIIWNNGSTKQSRVRVVTTLILYTYLYSVRPHATVLDGSTARMDGLMDQIFSEDPYLAFQPPFAYTLPIQLLVSGITLTLLCVLAIHLICELRSIAQLQNGAKYRS